MMSFITSVDNARVKATRALHRPKGRRESGLCLLEGPHLVQTALEAGVVFNDVFVSLPFVESERGKALLQQLRAARMEVTTAQPHVLERLSDTQTPQGIVAVAPMQPAPIASFQPDTAIVVADRIADPGNMGTIIRSAAATGAAVWSSVGTTDLYDPKALRASVGTLFHTKHSDRLAHEDIVAAAKRFRLQLVAADADGCVRYDEWDWTAPFALIVGNEARGVSAQLREAADAVISLPLALGVESLNAAVTASVCLFEAARQRGFTAV